MQVSRFALAAGLAELRNLARGLGPLDIFSSKILGEYAAFMGRSRSASTVYSYLVALKRGSATLGDFIRGNMAWKTGNDGICATWVAYYDVDDDDDGAFVPIHYTASVLSMWSARMSASTATLAESCSSAKKQRELNKTRGQMCFRSRWAEGSIMYVLLWLLVL